MIITLSLFDLFFSIIFKAFVKILCTFVLDFSVFDLGVKLKLKF